MSRMIARKTETLHVHVFGLRPVCAINFSRDQSSGKLINFLDSRLETRYSKLSRIESRGSRLEGLSTYFWAVLYMIKVDQHFAHTLSVVIFIIRAQR